MYLKEIKVSGFKSFADKMSLNLDNDITCVVGPNGSGKSNIVDAVKWVLGEQSVKSLRGSNNMSDVIFSGSKTRNPLNLASVTLIFDNSDSYIKIPYNEIAVQRKVFRTGENEYFINNEKCRLKDIHNLFLDTGMGKYAFNIISQGEIVKIINDSPKERRAIFEEAAGVLKYKKRKEEALRKLEKTNNNLIRIKDIINEIEDRLEPLEQQSQKAQKYKKTKEELENIEIGLITNDLEKYNIIYKSTKEELEQLENSSIKINSDNSKNDLKLDEEKEKLNEINYKIVELNNKFIKLSKDEERINGEKNIIKERSKYDSDDIKVHDNLINLKEKKHILNNKVISLNTDLNIIKEEEQNLKETLITKQKEIKNKEQTKNQIENDLYSKEKELINYDYKIKSLTKYIEEFSDIPSSVKRVLTNPKLRGIHDVIKNLIKSEEKYQVAISVALGGSKNYVVIDTPKNAKESINYLKENKLGRVTFYPIESIKSKYVDENTMLILQNEKGFIDILTNKVNCDNNYQNIVNNRLGNIILVDNIDNANIISKKINKRYQIVTLEGETINVGGSITGGSINKKDTIDQKHELKSLKLKSTLIENEIEKLKQDLKKYKEDLTNKQNDIFNKEKAIIFTLEKQNKTQEEYEQTKKEYTEIELEIDNLENLSSENLKTEEEKIIEKYYNVQKEKEELAKEIEKTNKEKQTITDNVENLETRYRMNNKETKELEERIKDLEIKNSKLSVKMDNLLEILNEYYSMTYEKAKNNYVLEIEEDIARKRVKELKRIIKELGEVNITSIEEYEKVNTRYEMLSKQTNDLKEGEATLLKIIDELDEAMKKEFITSFKEIQKEFDKVFKELFNGGEAKLKLTDKENILETGIEIEVYPPGKKLSSISLLSGGEKTLTAISLLFAILNLKQIPFCLFDEVEAALDEYNVDKVCEYFNKYKGKTQLIIITHKKKTMEYANSLYGITMQESGVSKLVSVKLVD